MIFFFARQWQRITYILFFTVFSSIAFGQSINGVVIDQDGFPMLDVYLFSNDQHSHTDFNGQFHIENIQSGDTLTISHIGYESIQRVVKEDDLNLFVTITLNEDNILLDQVAISSNLRTTNNITSIDLKINPLQNAQEVLRTVPGLFIAQHAGGGKAEQIFLRGFDIDHGTDIAITVDGLPVNMVSHAHGQGYADLHFVIPETIEKIDFAKGPYYAQKGNFNTAGYVDFQTKDRIDNSSVGLEIGRFNTQRLSGLFDILGDQNKNHSAYIASEYLRSDGPFESPQEFSRLNFMGKYTGQIQKNTQLKFTASHLSSSWDASGQIPQRLVDNGTISRFGAVDDTEGGSTSRTNIAVEVNKSLTPHSQIKTSAYLVHYDFELYSNFTFFLNNPDVGDQIRQQEERTIYGVNSDYLHTLTFENFDINLRAGLGFRFDDVDNNELAFSINRIETNYQLAYGDVEESNVSAYASAEIDFGDFIVHPGLRVDRFNFDYDDFLNSAVDFASVDKSVLTPHLNVLYNPSNNLQLFAKSGYGFHSNDSRVVVARTREEILPLALGTDIGAVWKPFKRLWLSGTLWRLALDQEFVYVGDEAVVEPSGKTVRKGIEFGIRAQLSNALFAYSDFTFTDAEAVDEAEGENKIPLAPTVTGSGGLTYSDGPLSTSLRYRYISDRPANEDNSIIAEGYLVVDGSISYSFNDLRLSLSAENVLNTEWNEAQFATESRLSSEAESTEELHFTPGTPFALRGGIFYSF